MSLYWNTLHNTSLSSSSYALFSFLLSDVDTKLYKEGEVFQHMFPKLRDVFRHLHALWFTSPSLSNLGGGSLSQHCSRPPMSGHLVSCSQWEVLPAAVPRTVNSCISASINTHTSTPMWTDPLPSPRPEAQDAPLWCEDGPQGARDKPNARRLSFNKQNPSLLRNVWQDRTEGKQK